MLGSVSPVVIGSEHRLTLKEYFDGEVDSTGLTPPTQREKKQIVSPYPMAFPRLMEHYNSRLPYYRLNDKWRIKTRYENQVREKDIEITSSILGDDNYTLHDPIVIYGDEDFTSENGVVGGSGTAEDPYIIEGWLIIGSGPYTLGIEILSTSAYFVIRNCMIEAGLGIGLFYVTHGVIDSVELHVYWGISCDGCTDIVIRNLSVQFKPDTNQTFFSIHGIHLDDSKNVYISNCRFHGTNLYGVGAELLSNTMFCSLTNLTFIGIPIGFFIFDSSYNIISDCKMELCKEGIYIQGSESMVLKNNSIYVEKHGLYIFGDTKEEYLHDIDTSNTINGKPVYYLRNQSDLVFNGNEDIGYLALIDCDNVLMKNMEWANATVGILLVGTTNSTITASTFTDNWYSIFLFASSNNLIHDCIHENSTLFIFHSPYNILRNNTFITIQEYGLGVFSGDGGDKEDYYQDIDTSNMVNGKPVYYLINQDDQEFIGDEIGYLALIDCKDILIFGVRRSNCFQGLLLVNTTALVKNSRFLNNWWGIMITYGGVVKVHNCLFKGNYIGVLLYKTSHAYIINCKCSYNSWGIYIGDSHDNTVRGCKIINFSIGVILFGSSLRNLIRNNEIYRGWSEGIRIGNGCMSNDICFNTIYGIGSFGVLIFSEPSWWRAPALPILQNRIHNNTIYNTECGIVLWNDFEGYINGTQVYYNTIYDTTDWGFWNDGSNFTVLHHNTLHNTMGIKVEHSEGVKIYRNNIYGNTFGLDVYYCPFVNATNNWWGSRDGPSGIGPGSGDPIYCKHSTVSYEPWLKHKVLTKTSGLSWIFTLIRSRLLLLYDLIKNPI
jgi:parallel beta-helix repeat protein